MHEQVLTQVWITSLTSYWWLGVSNIVPLVKSIIPKAKVVLYGQYPRVEAEHARQNSEADVLITDGLDLSNCCADFSLYTEHKPSFCGLDARAANWQDEALEKYKSGVADFVFFNDDILDPAIDLLGRLRVLREQLPVRSNRRLRFHAICGLYPSRFTEQVAKEMKGAEFVELHFEQQVSDGELDIDAYMRARRAYHAAGYSLAPNELSGFLFIGTPNDDLELIVRRMLNLLEVWGSVILKPYTPDPTLSEYRQYRHNVENEEIERLSPHAFPFSRVNGIAYENYDELYTLAAVLNHKVKNKAFNSFPGTLAFEMIRTSLEREVWKLGYEERTAH